MHASALQLMEVPVAKNEMKGCTGAKSSFDAGYGGCGVYAAGRNMHKFCGRDIDETQRLYASQVCDECKECAGGDHARKADVKAYGDPHMQNVFGQRFDLMQPGEHSLLQIPRGVRPNKALLRVVVSASRVGANCLEMYIMKVNVTGGWVEKAGRSRLHFEGGVSDVSQSSLYSTWLHFGPVDLKVVQGTTVDGMAYLNFFVRKLTKTRYHVGGLLGEDSHDVVATPSGRCLKSLNLAETTHDNVEGPQVPTRSMAEVVDVM
jgi:hypothetical protein